MEYLIPTSKLAEVQNDFAVYRIKRLRKLYKQLFYCVLFSGLYLILYYVDLEHVRFSNFISVYEVPVIWLFCVLIQFAFYYADRIPILKTWQSRLTQKYFIKYNQSYENRYLGKISKYEKNK